MKISKPFKEGDKTWATISELFPNDNREFKVRFIPEEKTTLEEDLLIGGDEFESALRNPEKNWNDDNEGFYNTPLLGLSGEVVDRICRNAYDHIFFFTDNTTLNYSDDDLVKDMAEENPDYFL